MSVPKLKNLIILILVLVNIVLLSLVIPLRLEEKSQQEESVARLQALFASYNLTLSGDSLPITLPLYTLELTPGEGAALTAVRALLGETVLAQDDSTRYLSLYQSEQGQCEASRGGAFDARLTSRAASADPAQEVTRLLSQMQLAVSSVTLPARTQAGVYELTATQQLLGVPVFSSALTFTYDAGALTQIHGTALFDTTTLARVDETACMGAADALVAFLGSRDALGWVGGTVRDLAQGYLRAETASAAIVRLIPGWRIATDTGMFWVNGITREVSALGA